MAIPTHTTQLENTPTYNLPQNRCVPRATSRLVDFAWVNMWRQEDVPNVRMWRACTREHVNTCPHVRVIE